MVSLIATYLLVGAGFMFTMDLVLQWLESPAFTNWERFVGILGWPVFMVVFLFYFIREMF